LPNLAKAQTEPFEIVEATIYGLYNNKVYIEFKNLLDKDQYIENVTFRFYNSGNTQTIGINDIKLYRDYQEDVYGSVNISQGKYNTLDRICDTKNATEICIDSYLDDAGKPMDCTYILEDKSCLKQVQRIVGTVTKYDYFDFPATKKKIYSSKLEQKISGLIPLLKNGNAKISIDMSHLEFYGITVSDLENKYDIVACSSDGCVVLDPNWYSSSWTRRKQWNPTNTNATDAVNAVFISNVTDKTHVQSGCEDVLVVNTSSNTTLPFKIINTVDYCTVRVTVNISASTTLSDIYVYYGNPNTSAPTYYNLNETLLYDDFTTFDTSKWWNDTGTEMLNSYTGGFANVTDGILFAGSVYGSTGRDVVSMNSYTIPFRVETYVSLPKAEQWSGLGLIISDANGSYSGFAKRNMTALEAVNEPPNDLGLGNSTNGCYGLCAWAKEIADTSIPSTIYRYWSLDINSSKFVVAYNGSSSTLFSSTPFNGLNGNNAFVIFNGGANYEKSYLGVDNITITTSIQLAGRTSSLGDEEAYDTTAPLWQNQGQNATFILVGEAVKLYAQGYDDIALDWAWLETNETGIWENKTAYYSIDMEDASATWEWSNFTWQNSSVEDTVVGWRIYYDDVAGNENRTDVVTFDVKLVNITFNITNGEDGSQLTNINIYCNNYWNATGVNSPYSTSFLPGNYSCTFNRLGYYNKTITFEADNDKIIDIIMEEKFSLTIQEHDWLSAIYECVVNGDCTLYNLLIDINETTSKIWNQFKRTDQSIVTFENVTSSIVSNTSNLTIDYTVNIPIKEGYGVVEGLQGYDDFLPIRISYWFLDETNTTCYNEGDKLAGVEAPYCNPLTVQTVGQINTSINFTVDLRPDLPEGEYSIVRNIEIDPDNVWVDYGQEIIGKVKVLTSGESLISLRYAEENIKVLKAVEESTPKAITDAEGSITGLAILLTSSNLSLMISVITFCLVLYLVLARRH
jgi:hypothetical protein